MAYNYSMQPTLPPDTGEKPSLGAARIRNLKNALIERLTSWVYGFDTTGNESDVGVKHIPLVVQSDDPATPTDSVRVYSKDVSSKAELFVKDEDGSEIQVTDAGVLKSKFANYDDTKTGNTLYQAPYSGILFIAVEDFAGFSNPRIEVADNSSLTNKKTFYISGTNYDSYTIPIPKGYYYKFYLPETVSVFFC